MGRLFKRLFTTRRLLYEHTVLLQRLRRKVKTRVKVTNAQLPRQVFVSPYVQPLTAYNRFVILVYDQDQPTCKS